MDQITFDKYDALYNRGYAFINAGVFDSAIECFTDALWLAPHDHNSLTCRGRAFLGKGDYGSAIEDFSDALMLAPGFRGALHGRGLAYAFIGDLYRAAKDLAAYSHRATNDPQVVEMIEAIDAERGHGPFKIYFGTKGERAITGPDT